ncbi:uncharacterized protein LOC129795621 [Lutzomyia longipalpis]|uniref:uncharacterized protein LOC129795621 n=1 Tax=Lutzomyia longipalpis TaxID=7200 RepID=UPI0024841EB1|nr:uncharacterized protein LOC129795621 [Lutzomyia longipalpis]
MAAAPIGAGRKRTMNLITESEFPPLDSGGQKSKRNRNIFVFGRGEESESPRYLVVERSDDGESMKALSVFKVKREISKLVGKVKRLQPLLQGKSLLIEIASDEQADKLLKLKNLAGKPVKISWHPSMNKSKGIIACYDWTYIPLEELKEELKAFNVSDVKAIKRKVEGGKMIDTGTFIVTFDSPKLPESIDAFYYPLKVKTFIPNPARCFKCQKYGHFVDKCRMAKKICAKCLHNEHEGECVHPHVCANCGEDHLSWSRKCTVFKQEFSIMKIKVTQKISYFAAKQEYMRTRSMDLSFAETVAKSKATKLRKQISGAGKTVFPGYEQDKPESAGVNGVGLPSIEFVESLRMDRMETDEAQPGSSKDGQPSSVSLGGTSLGAKADLSTGNISKIPSTGTVIKNALNTLIEEDI